MMRRLLIVVGLGMSLLLCSCFQFWSYDLNEFEQSSLLPLKKGARFEFVSNNNDKTIFEITRIERRDDAQQGIPNRFFYGNTFINVYCNVKGNTKSANINSDLYMEVKKSSKSSTSVFLYFGNGHEWTWLYTSPDGVSVKGEDGFYAVAFTDTEHFERGKEIDNFTNDGRGIISYIWSKRYGLLQYTTADSLVWTRINIEEPTEK